MTKHDTHTIDGHPAHQRIVIAGMGALGTLMAWHCRSQSLFTCNRQRRTEFSLQTFQGTSQGTSQNTNQNTYHNSTGDREINVDTFTAPEWEGETADWLVITTKASATLTILNDLKDRLKNTSRILLLQNGMGQQAETAAWLEENNVDTELWVGSSTEGAYREDNGVVIHAGKGHTLAGRWQPTVEDGETELPPSMQLAADIKQVLHEKLAINAIINPLTAHYRCRNGELLTSPEKHRTFKALSSEVAALFHDLNWQTGFDIEHQATRVAEATAQNQSSTFQDVLHRRPTELPYICGYLLKHAQQHGLRAPLTEQLYQSISALEAAW